MVLLSKLKTTTAGVLAKKIFCLSAEMVCTTRSIAGLPNTSLNACVRACVRVCVRVCVCEREREREREGGG